MVPRLIVLTALALLTSAAAVPPKSVDHIEYVAWDGPGQHWSAKIADDGMGFVCAPEGDWKRARPAVLINYVAPNGTEWTALIMNGRFVNSANGAGISFESSEMSYRAWDGATYSIRLDLKNKRFLQDLVKAAPGRK